MPEQKVLNEKDKTGVADPKDTEEKKNMLELVHKIAILVRYIAQAIVDATEYLDPQLKPPKSGDKLC